MSNFQDKEEYIFDDIQSLIDSEIEESIHLDFKSAEALDKSDGKRKELSKDISAFANSDGGIIIYGIIERNHKAHSLSYVDGNIYTKEWLEQTINSSIQRRISDLKIFPIRNNGNISETVYIVKIPRSYDAPHLCKDKRFYKRFNFESVFMEEYEIRQSYGQKLKSKLSIDGYGIGQTNRSDINRTHIDFSFEAEIYNEGEVVENEWKLNVYFINMTELISVSIPRTPNYDYTRMDHNKFKISSNNLTAIYPKEKVNAIRFDFRISIDKIEEALEDVRMEIRLFYNGGEDKLEFGLDWLKQKLILNLDN
jgi:hypothetical protein